jgi:hypothetical protein
MHPISVVAARYRSARRKWARAEEYREMLEADFLQFGQSGPGSLQFDRSTDQVQGSMKLLTFTVRFGSDAPNLSEDFPMILGDAVHNYRGALDHLTWELVRRFSTRLSPSDARKVQFPMHNNAKDFDNWKERRTPGVPDKPHRALLKRYQPYRSGDGPKAVRWLRRLSDHDKHRDLIPTVVAPQGSTHRVRKPVTPEFSSYGAVLC